MSSTPILLIYVQLWLIQTDHQLGTFRLNQSITFTEIPLSTLQFFTVNIVYIVSSITSKWEKPVALIKSLAKNWSELQMLGDVFIDNYLNIAKHVPIAMEDSTGPLHP